MADVDVIVVGAGVVGLAVARELALGGESVIVLEAAGAIGTGTSSRNSEVIHAGLYYPPNSLKARLCVEGRHLLYDFCAAHGVAHRRCGKLVVACDDAEHAAITALAAQGAASGTDDLELLDGSFARAMEPALGAGVETALWSPSTGIIDSHGLMLALQGDLEAAGGAIALRTPFASARAGNRTLTVTTGGGTPAILTTARLVNTAGLAASQVARAITGLDGANVPETRFAKGNYFTLAGRAPFSRLIYPAPHTHGLGVHLTLDLGGQARFGPDVEWVETIDYAVDPARSAGFDAAIRRYWPGLPNAALVPAYSGIRPKITAADGAAADFRIDGPERHGVPGLINLFGIESPGLTASLALAREVAQRLAAA